MSAGEYYAPVAGTAWQPPQGWDIYVGDPPYPYPPTAPFPTWIPQVYPEAPSKRMPDNCQIITTTDTRSLWLNQNSERIAALEAEVKRLGRECKRLKRRLAQRRRP